jgi:hypothetical protein
VQHFCHLPAADGSHGMAVLLALPGAVACHLGARSLEIVTHRNATQEKAYRLFPIPACPAKGHELEETLCQYAIVFTGAGNWQANRLPQRAREYAGGPWIAGLDTARYRQLIQEVTLDSEDVWAEAWKPAWRGEGIIVRLASFTLPDRPIRLGLRGAAICQAWECDGRERDLQLLPVEDGQAHLTMQRSITSVRLLLGSQVGDA